MDLATLGGMVVGFGLIIWSITMGSSLSSFINIPGLAIVVGGTVCATLISERMGNVLGTIKVAMNAFFSRVPSVPETIKTLVEYAGIARKSGLLSLESQNPSDPFLAKGIRMAVDGVAPEEIRRALEAELESRRERHKRGQKIFKFMAATAPAMGMIGTLVGLVQMLQALDDPSALGPGMAVALLTTLYGAIMAFMLFGPLATKLETRTEEELANMNVVLDGMDGLIQGQNPRILQERLEGFLAPRQRSQEGSQEEAK